MIPLRHCRESATSLKRRGLYPELRAYRVEKMALRNRGFAINATRRDLQLFLADPAIQQSFCQQPPQLTSTK